MKPVPEIYEKSFVNGSFNLLTRDEQEILVMRFENPRMSTPQVSKKIGRSLGFINKRETLALQKLENWALGKYPTDPDDFIIG